MKTVIVVGVLGAVALLAGCGEKDESAVAAAPAEATSGSVAGDATGSAVASTADGQVHRTTGRIAEISGSSVTVDHQPVQTHGWPAMSMAFQAPDPSMLEGLQAGANVQFGFKQDGGQYVLTEITKQ